MDEIAKTSLGMVPLRLFAERSRLSKYRQLPRLADMPPSKPFQNNPNIFNRVIFLIEDGICPESLLPNNANASKLASFPILVGREPFKRFCCSSNKFKLASFSIPIGMLPKIRLLSKCKLVTSIDKLAIELGKTPLRRLFPAPNVTRLVQLVNEVMKLKSSSPSPLPPRLFLLKLSLWRLFRSPKFTGIDPVNLLRRRRSPGALMHCPAMLVLAR